MSTTRSYVFVLVFASAFTVSTLNAQDHLFSNEAKQKAEALLKQMSLDEKVGQLNQLAGIVMPGIADEKPDNLIMEGRVGSVLWLNDVKWSDRRVLTHVKRSV
jgi:beta-glucosidase